MSWRDDDPRPYNPELSYDTWRYRGGNRYGGDYAARRRTHSYLDESTRPYSRRQGSMRYDRGWTTGYDRDLRTVGLGYDREYKSRWQTDAGDPFGDRQNRTPIRVMRGHRYDYDRGFRGGGRGWFGREPYDRYYRGYTRYDRSWF